MRIVELLAGDWSSSTLIQLGDLCLALGLSALIGLEREIKAKSAGLRTHTLVGVAAALIMVVSKYGFEDVLAESKVVLDPSRVAAQIVSGIGFIGGGLIFVQRDVVRGLTTAAIIWLTAAVGMACGAGLPIVAVFVTAAHFLVIYGFSPLERLMLSREATIVIDYRPGKGVIQETTEICAGHGYVIHDLTVRAEKTQLQGNEVTQRIELEVRGRRGFSALVVALSDVKDVISARLQ